MRAKEGNLYIFYMWFIVAAAIWQLFRLFPALDLNKGQELLIIVLLGVLAEWLAVSFPHGQLSGGFALVLSTFLIYGPAAAAWVNGLAAVLGQGIANRGNPLRTTLFNAGQYVIAVAAASYAYEWSGRLPGLQDMKSTVPLAIFAAVYIIVNHLLIYLYLLPKRHSRIHLKWFDTLKWDGLTYLFTIPLGLLIAKIYGYTGLSGTLLLFTPVLSLQFILRYYVRLQVTNRELTAFYEIASLLEGNAGLIEIVEKILESAGKAFPFHTGVIYLRSGEGGTYLPAAAYGPFSALLKVTTVYAGEGTIGSSLAGRRPEIIYDTRDDQRTVKEPGLSQVLRSMLIVPLLSMREELGVIVLGDKKPYAFDQKHLHIMVVLGAQVTMAAENAVLQDRLELALSRDTLTGLLCCSSFTQVVSEACASAAESHSSVGLVLLDIDRFKEFNRQFGRESAEKLLAELAALIEGSIRRADKAARYGGDEFALLLPGAGGTRLLDEVEDLWKKIRGHVFLKEEGQAAVITVSMGAAEFPRDAGEPAGLFYAAQQALEKAKEKGGDEFEFAAAPLFEQQRINL